jgi:hypothetical protein
LVNSFITVEYARDKKGAINIFLLKALLKQRGQELLQKAKN